MPLSRPTAPPVVMPATVSLPSRFAVWKSLESKADRWASYGALGVAALAVTALLIL